MPAGSNGLRAATGAAWPSSAHATATPLTRAVVWLAALASGLAVASAYYAQPLLDAIAHEFGLGQAEIGAVVTCTQVGYGLGLLLLVPLGDLLDRRRLIIGQTAGLVLALAVVAAAPAGWVFLAGMAAVGALAVVTQLHVAHASALADAAQRGRVVGAVTSGIITGILLARAVSGVLADVAGWRAVFAVAAAANLAIVWALCKALPPQRWHAPRMRYVALVGSLFALWREERVLRERASLALLAFMAMTVLWTPMVLALRAPPHALTHAEVGLFGLAGVLGALGATRAGRWADRGRGQRTTAIALALMLLSWAAAALLPLSLWSLVVAVLVLDFGLQALHVTNQSLIYRVRPEAQSRQAAAYMVCYSIGCALGSIASTVVYDLAGWPGVCTLGASISAAAWAWWVATLRAARAQTSKPFRP